MLFRQTGLVWNGFLTGSSAMANDVKPVEDAPEMIAEQTSQLPAYDVNVLTKGGDQAHLVLGQEVYTLRITRMGKLIVTK